MSLKDAEAHLDKFTSKDNVIIFRQAGRGEEVDSVAFTTEYSKIHKVGGNSIAEPNPVKSAPNVDALRSGASYIGAQNIGNGDGAPDFMPVREHVAMANIHAKGADVVTMTVPSIEPHQIDHLKKAVIPYLLNGGDGNLGVIHNLERFDQKGDKVIDHLSSLVPPGISNVLKQKGITVQGDHSHAETLSAPVVATATGKGTSHSAMLG